MLLPMFTLLILLALAWANALSYQTHRRNEIMAGKRRKKGGRRRPKPGLLSTAMGLSALSYATGYGDKHPVVQAIQGAFPPSSKFPGGKFGKAVVIGVVGQLAHTEANKMHVNPMILNRGRLI